MIEPYLALRARVDRLAASIRARCEDRMMCKPSCCDCCLAGLTVTVVEAAAISREFGIQEEKMLLEADRPPLFEDGLCGFLDSQNLCSIYSSRPLVCRTHGLPLKYPDAESITACEKNFLSGPLPDALAVDMNNLETALFAANLRYCKPRGLNPLSRVALDRLAAMLEGAKTLKS